MSSDAQPTGTQMSSDPKPTYSETFSDSSYQNHASIDKEEAEIVHCQKAMGHQLTAPDGRQHWSAIQRILQTIQSC
jgi:hypothetical protein